MLQTWKILPLAVFAALGALLLMPGGAARPTTVNAYNCATPFILDVEIFDIIANSRITAPGTLIRISPDPQDSDQAAPGTRTYVDNSTNDDSNLAGLIREIDACATGPAQLYTITLLDLPENLTCVPVDSERTTSLAANTLVQIRVANCGAAATPTSSVGPASTIVVTSANTTLGCGSTTIITITVRGSNGQPVANGTLVNITANIGSVSPTSGQTTADGSVFVFYTAPQNQGGAATITAASGTASGTVNIAVNCATAPTQAPPPTTAPSGTISPPSTGDGGIASSRSWQTYAGIALIITSVIATLVVIRPRA